MEIGWVVFGEARTRSGRLGKSESISSAHRVTGYQSWAGDETFTRREAGADKETCATSACIDSLRIAD